MTQSIDHDEAENQNTKRKVDNRGEEDNPSYASSKRSRTNAKNFEKSEENRLEEGPITKRERQSLPPPPFLQCHLCMLKSLYIQQNEAVTSDDDVDDSIWERISSYLLHRSQLQQLSKACQISEGVHEQASSLLQNKTRISEKTSRSFGFSSSSRSMAHTAPFFHSAAQSPAPRCSEAMPFCSLTLLTKMMLKQRDQALHDCTKQKKPYQKLAGKVLSLLSNLRQRYQKRAEIVAKEHTLLRKKLLMPRLGKGIQRKIQNDAFHGKQEGGEDLEVLCNKIYLWERLSNDLEATVTLS